MDENIEGILYNEIANNFTQLSNHIITDLSIRHTSFRLYCYYASRPTGWKIRNSDIKNKIGISKDTIASCNRELEERGWLVRTRIRDKNGRFKKKGGVNYRILAFSTKIGKNPKSEKNLDREKTASGKNPTLNNTEVIASHNINTGGNYTLQDAARGMKYLEKVEKSKKYGTGYMQKPRSKSAANDTA